MATVPPQQQQQQQQRPSSNNSGDDSPWPLFDLFVDLPHPAASKLQQHFPARVISSPAPDSAAVLQSSNNNLSQLISQIQRFSFPEYDEAANGGAAGQEQERNQVLNKYDQYAMQPKSFTSFTFSLQLQDGSRLYGHVRRTLPMHPIACTRYDVGRRGERALVILTRAFGADLLYQAILKYVQTKELCIHQSHPIDSFPWVSMSWNSRLAQSFTHSISCTLPYTQIRRCHYLSTNVTSRRLETSSSRSSRTNTTAPRSATAATIVVRARILFASSARTAANTQSSL